MEAGRRQAKHGWHHTPGGLFPESYIRRQTALSLVHPTVTYLSAALDNSDAINTTADKARHLLSVII